MPSNKKLLQAAAGSAGGDKLFPEDVFSTYLYTGNSTARSINNGLDLSGEGGLVWIKNRTSSGVDGHVLYDTERGVNKYLSSDSTAVENSGNTQGLMTFNNNGFSLGTDNYWNVNRTGINIASWSFRKAAGFCDIVTYTGNGSARTIAHNLGSVPKMIIVKSISDAYNWYVYHASLTNQQNLTLDTTSAAGNSGAEYWNSTTATSSVFSLGTYFGVNGASKTYVAYVFGDDAIFGEDGDEQICKIDSYTGTGSNGNTITLGFEPQWLLWKPSSGTGDWQIVDSMRGWTADGVVNRLEPNTTDVEAQSGSTYCNLTSTGFVQNGSSGSNNASGTTYIYMAIRRPMKVPTAGTEAFNIGTYGANRDNSSTSTYYAGFPVDMAIKKVPVDANANNFVSTRMLGTTDLKTNSYAVERTGETEETFDSNTRWNSAAGTSSTSYSWMFKRAPQFMDVVAYTGTGSNRTLTHNLGIAPEMMWVKNRTDSEHWAVYHKHYGGTHWANLNELDGFATSSTIWNNTNTTASVFTVGTSANTNQSSKSYIAYLFGSIDGVSKVGSYTGNGSTQTIDCGFSAGARFVIIKKSSESGNYMVFDSVRGIVSGNSPYLNLNNTSAEVTNTDKVDPAASGFAVNVGDGYQSDANESGQTYIFLAIA